MRIFESFSNTVISSKVKKVPLFLFKFYLKGQVCANPCPPGTYGVDCKNRCDCYNGALCDHVSGQCHCLPGFQGEKVIYIWKFSNTLMSDLSDSVTQKYSRRKIIFSPYFFGFIFSSEKKCIDFPCNLLGHLVR